MPCHQGFRLRLPFDLHSAAMFDSHMPCRDHAIVKATSHAVPCVNYHWVSTDIMWAWNRRCELAFHQCECEMCKNDIYSHDHADNQTGISITFF
jgi:hypothetical protein